MRLIGLLTATFICFSTLSFATENSKDCAAALTPKPAAANTRSSFVVKPSPRVPSEAAKYKEYVQELTAPGGVLDKLGIEMTGQVVEFLQPRDLNALTSGSAGGYPVSHYLDGAAVVRAMKPSGGFALEVVYPGPEYQHGFYRDDNQEDQQISIIDHVVGHNNFAFKSGLRHYRVGQGLRATRELDDLLQSLYVGFDKDQVQRYYLWLMTLMPLVDWYAPHFNYSKEFEPVFGIKNADPLGRTRAEIMRHPRSVTENVLQAFTANLSPHEPEWKRNMLEKMIVSMAFRPALVHTQIMNEGWASIMQEILPYHTKRNHNFRYWLQASRVMQTESWQRTKDHAEKTVRLNDPYSLGVNLWRRAREQFEARPEIKAMAAQIDKDAAFIKYAGELIETLTDEEFIRKFMDQLFVDRFKLAVVRRADQGEQDPHLPPPPQNPNEPPPAQWIILSREADRVSQMVIDSFLKPKYYYNPRVKLVDFSRPSSGEVELVLDDEASRAFPLKTDTLAPSLYALANVIQKPVSIEAMIEDLNAPRLPDWLWNLPDEWREYYMEMYGFKEVSLIRVRVVVSPSGEVRTFRVTKERPNTTGAFQRNSILEERPDDGLNQVMVDNLRAYVEDLYLEDDRELQRVIENSQSLKSWLHETTSKIVEDSPYDGLVSQSPNSAGAIAEFKSMLDRRLVKVLENALKKKGGLQAGPKGVRVRALPSQVRLEFDRDYIQKLMRRSKKGQPGPIVAPFSKNKFGKTVFAPPPALLPNSQNQSLNLNRSQTFAQTDIIQNPFGSDQGGDGRVAPIDNGGEGDRFWGPGEGGGGGRGGPKPSEDEEDLSWVEIPEDLYSRYLGERVKLPILNKKPGQSRTMSKKPGGRISRRQGQMLPHEIMENALKRGIGAKAGADEDPFEDLTETFAEGFDHLQPRDWVVKSKRPVKKPDIKAVVTFVLDASGSTQHYFEAFKRFVNDMEAVIRYNYRGFDFRYIIFDTKAHIMKNRDEFFRGKLGGGTYYSVGLKETTKLFQEFYPRSQWDRYTFLLGDMEDFNPQEAMADIRKLLDESEYFGTVAGLYSDPGNIELMTAIMGEAQNNEAVGVTIIDKDGGYRIENIREVLKNEPE